MKKAEWVKIIDEKYKSVFSNERTEELFLALAGRGYLPRQLPPPFNSGEFKRYLAEGGGAV